MNRIVVFYIAATVATLAFLAVLGSIIAMVVISR